MYIRLLLMLCLEKQNRQLLLALIQAVTSLCGITSSGNLFSTFLVVCVHSCLIYTGSTVRPRLSGPLLSGFLAIQKKKVGYIFTEYVMHPT